LILTLLQSGNVVEAKSDGLGPPHQTVAELMKELRATKQLLADATRERDAACHASRAMIDRIAHLVNAHSQ
jgi:hypothetical protein